MLSDPNKPESTCSASGEPPASGGLSNISVERAREMYVPSAKSVEFDYDSGVHKVYARREVILSAGYGISLL